MTGLFDAFWRAAAYCLHPRVILLSLAPVLLAGGGVLLLGWLYWATAVDAVQVALSHWTLSDAVLGWLERAGFGGLRAIVAPLIIVVLAVPLVVLLSLLMVALLMTPAIVGLVAKRRFPLLDRRRGASGLQTTLWALGVTLLAVVVLAASLPLWLVPPLALVLPPLVWGWAGGKIFAFEVLAEHADVQERRTLLREHRGPLLAMGVVCGFMGAVPSLVWAIGVFALILAPLMLMLSVWLYTLVFAFAAAWFAHYALAALQAHRAAQAPAVVPPVVPPEPLGLAEPVPLQLPTP
ncbi:MAG: EI24 domain-containing protein [Rubrivivax sp.]|nr:EI24 domain-containing protein [Rubrivivax sp.]